MHRNAVFTLEQYAHTRTKNNSIQQVLLYSSKQVTLGNSKTTVSDPINEAEVLQGAFHKELSRESQNNKKRVKNRRRGEEGCSEEARQDQEKERK